jgi:hypothetical protein
LCEVFFKSILLINNTLLDAIVVLIINRKIENSKYDTIEFSSYI